MSGGSGGPIILKLVRDAVSVSVTKSGKYKLWHALLATHLLALLTGFLVGAAL